MAEIDLEALAARVSGAQRNALLALEPGKTYAGAKAAGMKNGLLGPLIWMGAVHRDYAGGNAVRHYRLTPLGSALRARLMEGEGETSLQKMQIATPDDGEVG